MNKSIKIKIIIFKSSYISNTYMSVLLRLGLMFIRHLWLWMTSWIISWSNDKVTWYSV